MGKLTPNNWFLAFAENTNQKPVTGEVLTPFIKEICGDKSSITFLDVGCSTAELSKTLCKALGKERVEFHGVDTASEDIKKAQTSLSNYQKTFYEGDCFTNEIQNQLPQADIILLSHVAYYALDLNAFAQAYIRKLSDNGVAIFISDALESDTNQFRTQFQASVQLHTASGLEDSLKQNCKLNAFSYKTLLKFPDNMKNLWESLGQVSYDNPAKTHQPNVQLAKNLLEFVVQQSLEDLQAKGTLDAYLTKAQEKLESQDNYLHIISRLHVAAQPNTELTNSERYQNAIAQLSNSIESAEQRPFTLDKQLINC